jgi:diacylglycerol kinase (ATP)
MPLNRLLSILGGPRSRFGLVSLVTAWLLWRRRLWSAAMLVSATGGMGAINSGIKALVRRQRPKGIPGLRQAGGYSFPSGHSSGSVVFFGALAYLAWRQSGRRLLTAAALGAGGVLAGAIGRSRVALRAHHWSDVFGGFGIGAGWLLLVLLVFDRRLRDEEQRDTRAPRPAPAGPELPIVLVTNTTSGRAKQSHAEIRECLSREGMRILETIPIKEIERLERWTGDSADDRPLIVAAGGDGTIGSVAGYLVDTESVLGILPAGTSNDIARSLGIPLKIEEAVRLLRDGERSPIDAGRFDAPGERPRYFLHAATAGINVAFARLATQSSFRQRLGKFTYVVAALAALREAKPFACDVEIEGRRTTLSLLQIAVVNAPVFGGLLQLELPDSRIDDRRLDVLAIEDMSIGRIALAALRVLVGRRPLAGGIRLYHVQEMAVHTRQPLAVTLDGEIEGTIPGTFSLRAEALRVIRPRNR